MKHKITWKISELIPFAYLAKCLQDFIQGNYRFSPLQQFRFYNECVRTWNYADRIILRCLLKILMPVFKHIILDNCFHLKGPNGVKNALRYIQNALNTDKFHYAIRADIKSYYASIDHGILICQVNEHFHDPKVKHYLDHVITTAVDDGGDVFIPEKGIPRRSSLSPFFGALYLSPVDRAFLMRKGIVYARYMDDIIILCQTKKQYHRARKILFAILRQLKLVLSPRKTWMGALKKGFHFLGANFAVSKREVKNQCSVTLQWISQANERDPTLAWFGTGLLLHPCFHASLTR
jgi:retron-type reverse transcriptase